MVDDAVDESREGASITKLALVDGVEDVGKVRVKLILLVEVGVAELLDVFGEVTEKEDVLLADLTGDFNLKCLLDGVCFGSQEELTLAPSQVPMISPPFKQNFMLLVPEASVPAVEMCSEMSLAGQMISALLTL